MKRVRLVDIANRLNITKVSVSKALRDHPDISLRNAFELDSGQTLAPTYRWRPNSRGT